VRGVRAAQETEAARLDADLQAAVAELTGLLKAAAREPARDDLDICTDRGPVGAFGDVHGAGEDRR
jgi:hypothetical protein